MWEREGSKDALRANLSPLAPYFGWPAINMCVCIGHRSSEIFCDKLKPLNVTFEEKKQFWMQMRFEVLEAVSPKMAVFRIVSLFTLVEVHQCFRPAKRR